MLDTILIALGTTLVTAFSGWVFYQRKHKAVAVGAEKNNDRTEIENYSLLATEWREAATRWKDLCDEYQTTLIENGRKIEKLVDESADNKREIRTLKALLKKANKRIAELEKHENSN